MESVIRVVEALVWPVVLFVLLARVFRSDIRQLLARFKHARYGDKELAFDSDPLSPANPNPPLPAGEVSKIHWDKSANLIWLVHDIHWTLQRLREGSASRMVLHGLRQSLHHATECGFAHLDALKRLRERIGRSASMLEADWTPEIRRGCFQDMQSVWKTAVHFAKMKQPDYAVSPVSENL